MVIFGNQGRSQAMLAVIACLAGVVPACRGGDTRNPTSGGSRELLVIEGDPSCDACIISVDTLFEFGAIHDPVLFRGIPVLASDSRGFVYAYVRGADDHEILRFAPDGQLAGVLGAYGRGPGEFRVIYSISSAPGDSVAVVHDGNAVSIFDAAGAYARTLRLPFRPTGTVIPLVGGGYLTSGGVGPPDAPPVHLLNHEGVIRASAGSGNILGPRYPERVLGVVRDGAWAAHPHNYLLEHFTTTDMHVRQRVLVRTTSPTRVPGVADRAAVETAMAGAPKLVGRPGQRVGAIVIPPPARIASIHAGGDGYLWVLSHVAALDYYEIAAEYRTDEFDVRLTDESAARMYATSVDVLDVTAGTIVVSAQFKGVGGLTQHGLFYLSHYTDEGIVRLMVGRLRIDRFPTQGRR